MDIHFRKNDTFPGLFFISSCNYNHTKHSNRGVASGTNVTVAKSKLTKRKERREEEQATQYTYTINKYIQNMR